MELWESHESMVGMVYSIFTNIMSPRGRDPNMKVEPDSLRTHCRVLIVNFHLLKQPLAMVRAFNRRQLHSRSAISLAIIPVPVIVENPSHIPSSHPKKSYWYFLWHIHSICMVGMGHAHRAMLPIAR